MTSIEEVAGDDSATVTAINPDIDGKNLNSTTGSLPPKPNASEGDAASRQRRKEKIMQSREDRLAKILSMASGRTVDPKEVHLDRTPSPTVSEVAAAGVGPALKVSIDDATTHCSSPASSLRTCTRRNLAHLSPDRQGRHTIVVALAAALFSLWNIYWNGARLSSSFEPWQVALSVFFVVQSVEYTTGRLHPKGLLSDCALFAFIILVVNKLLVRQII